MKHLVAMSLILIATGACNKPSQKAESVSEVESAAPSRVLVLSHSGGGLMPGYNDLKITEDGKVTYESQRFQNPVVTLQVARLSAKAVLNLKARMEGLENAPLVDQTPGAPHCLDSGTSTIKITNAHGTFEIKKSEGCHAFKRADGGGSEVINLIGGLSSLTY